MNEPPGLPSALGIEAVEWLGHGADTLTVRVRGRWRRRRPMWSGQALLVIEVQGMRHRYPAMPEPPSLTGAAPGTWQMSFAVPASVPGTGDARVWLQLGSVIVPLPVPIGASEPPAPGDSPGPVADDETLALRRIRAAELAAEAAARRLAESQSTVRALEERLDELEDELERERSRTTERARAVRAVEQREHAERALRQELEERLARLGTEASPDHDDEQRLRIEELERELARVRRSVDEAEQQARAAQAARHRAEQAVQELAAARQPAPDPTTLAGEFRAAEMATPAPPLDDRSRGPATAADRERLRDERQLVEARAAAHLRAVAALRDELETRARSEAQLRSELAALRARPGITAQPDPALVEALGQLRAELTHLRDALEVERAERSLAEERVAKAYEAIQEVRDELERIRVADGSTERREEHKTVDADRLTEALARLRASTPETEGEPTVAPWLGKALQTLARSDSAGAARLLEAMLPGTPAEATLARRMLAAGPLRRRVRRGGARIRGRRQVVRRLEELLRTRPRFAELRIEPRYVLLLAGAMIEPEWSQGERFTIAYNAGPYLHVGGEDRPVVSDAAIESVAATIVCGPELLAAVLTGERPAGTVILGEERKLELVQEWLERAQSG